MKMSDNESRSNLGRNLVLGASALALMYMGGLQADKSRHSDAMNKINSAAERVVECYRNPQLQETEDGRMIPNYHGLVDGLVDARDAHNEQNKATTDNNLQISKGQYVIPTSISRKNPLNWLNSIKTDSLDSHLQNLEYLAMEQQGYVPVKNKDGEHHRNSQGHHIYKLAPHLKEQGEIELGDLEERLQCGNILGKDAQLTDIQGNPLDYTTISGDKVTPQDVYVIKK